MGVNADLIGIPKYEKNNSHVQHISFSQLSRLFLCKNIRLEKRIDMNDTMTLLSELSMVAGVPGNEGRVRALIENAVTSAHLTKMKDNLGSLIFKTREHGPNIMLAGHMDEVGLMTTAITKDGFIRFQTLGGWFSQVMLAQVWNIHTDDGIIKAVTGVKPPHLIPTEKRNEAIPISDMTLDIGVSSKEEAEKLGIRPGQMVVPATRFEVLGDGKHLLSKAWDNRVGSAVLIDVLNSLDEELPNTLHATFTVQEEVGLRGAKTSSYMVHPDIAIAIDSGIANDAPGGNPEDQRLGKGPQILLYDAGLVPNKALRRLAIEVAITADIPYQEGIITGGRTDAGHMHLAHQGAAGLSITIPTRYLHSHTSIIHLDDYLNTVRLVKALLKRLDSATVNLILQNN